MSKTDFKIRIRDTFLRLLLSARGRHRESIVEDLPASTAIMSKSESPKEPKQLRKLFIGGLSFETTDESEEPFWAMGNAHRLCGNEGSKHQALQRLRVCHIRHGGGGGCGHECKATQGGRKSCGTKESRVKRRFSKTWCPLNCEKDFCWWH